MPKLAAAILAAAMVAAQPSSAQEPVRATYADLADLADAAATVVRVKVKDQAALKPERAPGVGPGLVRLYIEAETVSVLSGAAPLGQSLRYLVDVPLDARGKVPKLKKSEFVLFARTVPGRPGELQLVGPAAQVAWSPELEAKLRPVLAALVAADAPPHVSGVRDALSVAGNLVGESETQIFHSTQAGEPVSLSVIRRPGMAPAWGVSWSEIVDQAARPPAPDTLAWYRLACFLPEQLPASANLSRDPASRARAAADYRFVLDQLGPCPRYLTRG
jgi:hypothetical protein